MYVIEFLKSLSKNKYINCISCSDLFKSLFEP